MERNHFTIHTIVFCLLCMLTLWVVAAAQDIAGSKDSPLLKRYEGSTIIIYTSHEFDDYTLPLGPVSGNFSQAALSKSIKLEGKVTRITYLCPQGRSALEIVRNYRSELKSAGYEILFEASRNDLFGGFNGNFVDVAGGYRNIMLGQSASMSDLAKFQDDQHFLAARLNRPEGSVNVAVYAFPVPPSTHPQYGWRPFKDPVTKKEPAETGQPIVQVDIIESKPMETKMVTVSADEMATGIAHTGSIALYGIFFDTNSAEIKPESTPTIQEIVRLLQKQPDLKLLVVGHTDNVGTFGFNMDLSRRRANAVVQAITNGHGIDPERLMAVGVSYASPIASNKTEEGRAKNRRVQLVEN
jgi:OOP family OmpA-OmpF porin